MEFNQLVKKIVCLCD